VDEVSNIIKESIESTIGGNSYVHNKVNQWTNSVVESCLASLTKLQKPFKYIGKILLLYRVMNRLPRKMDETVVQNSARSNSQWVGIGFTFSRQHITDLSINSSLT
jgi:hypothetical protein